MGPELFTAVLVIGLILIFRLRVLAVKDYKKEIDCLKVDLRDCRARIKQLNGLVDQTDGNNRVKEATIRSMRRRIEDYKVIVMEKDEAVNRLLRQLHVKSESVPEYHEGDPGDEHVPIRPVPSFPAGGYREGTAGEYIIPEVIKEMSMPIHEPNKAL